jgi:trk system potassium uptake protein TrkH
MRRRFKRSRLGVDVGGALHLVGALVKYLSIAFLLPIGIALGYGEPAWPFLAAAAITAGVGQGLERFTKGKGSIGPREGFLVVALTWVLGAFFMSLPYLFAEPQLRNPFDAYFEAMSGMTTTGSSVLTDIPALSHSIAMWRQFTAWLGGMGIIVLALAVLPRLRVGGRQLMESEAPGPELEPLATSIRDTARRLWLLYVGITLVMILVLTAIAWSGLDPRMSFYEAVAHAFSTMPTAGFSTRARSIEEFGAASQWAITAFMIIAGMNFALLYYALVRGRLRRAVRDEELRLYMAFLGVATLLIFLDLSAEGIEAGAAAFRHAAFQTVSIMTTTGLVSTDFNLWTPLTALALVTLMFIGGSAGSTGGAIKPVRVLLTARIMRRELDQTVHREAVVPIRLNGRVIDERTLRAVSVFVLLYLLAFALGALILVIDGARGGMDVSPFEAISAAATTLGNVGPGFGFLGPMGSFEPFSNFSTAVMTVLMWMGRLELLPIVVLLTRSYWRA